MSLFENNTYQWRETYFVLFDESARPQAEEVQQALSLLDSRFEITEVRASSDGKLEALNLVSPFDHAAMDITYLDGEEVAEQIEEFSAEFKRGNPTAEENERLDKLRRCNARFDIFHFEKMDIFPEEEEEEFLDPGTLLIVMEKLIQLCHGVGIDPQSGDLQ